MEINEGKWAQRLRDPVWQFGGVVATIITVIISTLVAYDLYLKSQTQQELSVTLYQKFPMVYWLEEIESDIKVYYKGNEAHNVTSFYFRIENTGSSAIRPEDYVKPLRFTVEPPREIADVKIAEVKPASIDITVTQTFTNAIELSKSLLNPKDTVLLRVILVNDPDVWSEPQLEYSGRIAGIHEITFKSYGETSAPTFTRGYFSFSFIELLGMAVLTVLLFSITLFAFGKRLSGFWASRFIVAKTVLIAFMTGATVFWSDGLITSLTRYGGDSGYWKIWLLPVVCGGILIVIYILYLVFKLRLVTLSHRT